MSVKKYGIFIAYPPTVDLRGEGLGRYLASFLKGASTRQDIKFLIVCPSWSQIGLRALFISEGVPTNCYVIKAPRKKPIILGLYEAYIKYKRRMHRVLNRLEVPLWRQSLYQFSEFMMRKLAQATSVATLLPVILIFASISFILLLLSPVLALLATCHWLLSKGRHFLLKILQPFHPIIKKLNKALISPKESAWVLRLYELLDESEKERMLDIIQNLTEVVAWYCPTAFWPEFNRIKVPHLMCVPDVVINDFPAAFSSLGGERRALAFESLNKSIEAGQYFVTYSNTIKKHTLIERYAISDENIFVVQHAPNRLDNFVIVKGFSNNEMASRHYCEWLLKCAFQKSSNITYASGFQNFSLRFIFYASQFRPNKNIINLLLAYEFLLRKKYIPHKLILTGNPQEMPQVNQFISDHNLENDVLCLHGLTTIELAACYKLAEIAVNPSFSEGGCPFTYTEALSVGTPAVMAKIPVTMEVLDMPELQDMFFDPYDWKDMAERIEWGINHREELLAVQLPVYQKLSERTWTDVVNEHITILEHIASEPALAP